MSEPEFVKLQTPGGSRVVRKCDVPQKYHDEIEMNGFAVLREIEVETQTPVVEVASKKSQANIDMNKKFVKLGESLRELELSDFPVNPLKGKIADQGEQILFNVKNFLRVLRAKLYLNGKGTIFASETALVAAATGIGYGSVSRRMNLEVLPISRKRKQKSDSRRDKWERAGDLVDEQVKDRIRGRLQECLKTETNVTLENLLHWCKLEVDFPFGRTTLGYILHSMELCFRVKRHQPIIEERKDLISWRKHYLEMREKLVEENAFFAWMDETWIFSGMTTHMGWQYANNTGYALARQGDIDAPRPGPPAGKDKGKRAIVLGVVCEIGMLPGSVQILVTNVKESEQMMDYHKEMTADSFIDYMRNHVVPALASNAPAGRRPVLVIDNAPYHCRPLEKLPTFNSRKDAMKQFLDQYGKVYESTMLKPELYQLCQETMEDFGGRKRMITYELDDWAEKEHGVRILRLPPYHCHLNPIELVWGQMKNQARREGKTTDKVETIRKIALSFFENYSADDAQRTIQHVEDMEEELRQIIRNKQQATSNSLSRSPPQHVSSSSTTQALSPNTDANNNELDIDDIIQSSDSDESSDSE